MTTKTKAFETKDALDLYKKDNLYRRKGRQENGQKQIEK